METSLDFMSSLLDEIALEGLDGITLAMLWERLQHRPHFPLALDDDSKIFLWECIAVHKEVEIYELPQPRQFTPIYNRYEHIDNELGIVVEPAEKLVDPYYPVVFVKDGDVRGSCSAYETRKCITNDIRYDDVLLLALNQVVEKWGDSLVLVASPKARLLALIGTEINPLIDLSAEEYCLLERIGRSRFLGEVTQGEGGLLSLKANFCKQLHYNRKKLTVKGLITKQLHYMKNRKAQATTGSLFHLTRFYVQRKTKMEFLMKCMCDVLKEKPGQREVSKILREELGIKETSFKKLFYRPFSKWVKMVTLTHKEFYPNASPKECYTNNGQDRIVKVVQLIKHCSEAEENGEDTEEEDETEQKKVASFTPNIYFDHSKVYIDIPLITQVYNVIKEAGPQGISALDIGRIITLPRLDVRAMLRNLVRRGHIVTILQDRGRQKVTRYISKIFGEQNIAYARVKEQAEKQKDGLEEKEVIVNNAEQQQETEAKIPSSNNKCTTPNGILNKRKFEAIVDDKTTMSRSKRVRFNDTVEKIIFERYDKEKNDKINSKALKKLSKGNKVCKENKIPQNNGDGEDSDIQSNKLENFDEKQPELVSFEAKSLVKAFASSSQMTERKLKRVDIILEHLKSFRLSTLTDIQKYVMEKEKEEGYNFKVDKKSTKRLIQYLYSEKKLNVFKVVLKLGNQKVEIEFICEPTLETTDPSVKAAIEQAKFKYFSTSNDKTKDSTHNSDQLKLSTLENNLVDENPEKNILYKQPTFKTIYHSHPKFLRMKMLHQYLFYLVYQYEGACQSNIEPIVYHNSISWKRFIPPLPDYNRSGWCFVADIYSRMPLSVFVKIINLRHEIMELKDYLNHEEKAHYLLKHLPQSMRNNLLRNRKYLFSADDVMKGLCYMGLLSYGPQSMKQKDQVYLYVHKNASLKDTTISSPGYLHISNDLHYKVKFYNFNSMIDVDTFWVNLENVCFNTPLGKYSTFAGKTVAIAEASHKPELQDAVRNKSFDEICDFGFIPGDGLGAAGFDSSLFLHQRRNWQSSSNAKLCEKLKIDKSNVVTSTYTIQHLLKNKEKPCPEIRGRLQRLSKNSLMFSNVCKIQKEKSMIKKKKVNQPVTRKKERIKYRLIKMRPHKKRMPYYDEKDKAAIRKMDKSRCEWVAQEDSFLLLCKVASSFLDPSSRTLVVPYTVVRDLLHEHVPELSADKSSRACQRRMRYMMLNPSTTNNLAVFLGEAKQDMELVKEFEKVKPPKSQEDTWKDVFTAVLKRLIQKFTLPTSDRCKNITLPESLDEFHRKYQIQSPKNVFHLKSNYKNPESLEEIKCMKLYSLVVSAMAIANNDKHWSFLLHQLYQIYPENVLRSIVSRLRKEKIIAVKKKSCRKDLERSVLSTFPYKFSVTYNNSMLTKFPIKMFSQSQEIFKLLKACDSSIELTGEITPGHTAAVLSLAFVNELSLCFEIPDQIILFDTSLSEEIRSNIVQRMSHALSDKESVELSRLLNNDATQQKGSADISDSMDQNAAAEHLVLDDINSQSSNAYQTELSSFESHQSSEIQRFTNASRFALYLLRQELSQPPIERVQHSQDYIVLNSCRIFCKSAPHDGNQVLPINPEDIVEKSVKGSAIAESVSINRNNITLSDANISEVISYVVFNFPSHIFNENQNFSELLKSVYDAYSLQTLHDANAIFDVIWKANVMGIPEKEIWQTFKIVKGELSLFHHLRLLRQSLLVIRVGVSSFIYVCACYAQSWILESYVLSNNCCAKQNSATDSKNINNSSNAKTTKLIQHKKGTSKSPKHSKNFELYKLKKGKKNIKPGDKFKNDNLDPNIGEAKLLYDWKFTDTNIDLSEKVYFLPRTWRHPDGSLNKTVFFDLLSTILSYIISSPGTTSAHVCDKFSLVLQPVHILELIEVLEKIYCIYRYYCKPTQKCSLFSPPSTLFITETPMPEDIDHLESVPDALSKLSKLQESLS